MDHIFYSSAFCAFGNLDGDYDVPIPTSVEKNHYWANYQGELYQICYSSPFFVMAKRQENKPLANFKTEKILRCDI